MDYRNITPSIRDFSHYLSGRDEVTIIGELRDASVDPADFTRQVQNGGGYAVSIGTGLRAVTQAADAAMLAVLVRGITDDAQIYEAREAGADAIGVRVSDVAAPSLKTLTEIARSMHMDTILECSSADEVQAALQVERAVVGVDDATLLSELPQHRMVVVTAGIEEPGDVAVLVERAEGVIVGLPLLAAESVEVCTQRFADAAEGPA